MSSFFGELYLRSTLPFLSEATTVAESEYLASRLGIAPGDGAVLDLGCGHGRHAMLLGGRGYRVIGVENDPASLKMREGGFHAVRADMRALPFRGACFAAAYAWYSSLFVFEDDAHPKLLGGIARVLPPGALIIMHTVPFERLERQRHVQFGRRLVDGSVLEERSSFDPATGRDTATRKLTLPDGRILEARYAIRYYREPELTELFNAAGFAIRWFHGDLHGGKVKAESADLILGAERRNAC